MPTIPKPEIFGKIKDWVPWNDSNGDRFTDYAIRDQWAPVWKSDADVTLDEGQKNLTGSNFDFLQGYLKDLLSKGMPNQDLYRQNTRAGINTAFDRGATNLSERLAGSGMYRSGVGQNAFATLEGGRSSAIGQSEVELSKADQEYKMNALAKLLGLNQFEGGQNLNFTGMKLGQNNFETQFDYQKEQDKFNWLRDLLPGLIQGGAAVTGAYAGAPK